MNRRKFISSSSAGAAGAAAAALAVGGLAPAPVAAQASKKVLMKVGANGSVTEEGLNAVLRYGIKNITASAPIADRESGRLYATVDELQAWREAAEKKGVSIDILTPPNLASSHIDRERNPGIMLGKSPERDREIEGVQTMIKNCAAAKIPCIKYNMSILGVLRMGRVPGRADTSYSHFKIAGAKADPPLTKAGVVSEDAYWERITYFLERVIPVATEYKVRMACHPNDSPTPPEGYQGVHAVLSTVEGLKKFVSIKESPYHGFNFCIGTVSEMLMDPGKELYDVIRYFGTRKKIFNVHFRNILGNRLEFSEVAIDEGSFNAARAIATFKEVGYEYMVQHDHNVQAAGETNPNAYAAFVHGYIKALIQYAELA
ncbi:MAG TPA: mannonate dehydratase [Vicinamibacterales bacterium]|nr:mannonate dehydratase [Vicinamibacterales bacterium]